MSRKTWLGWLPAALWMALIFIGSTDLLADDHTSRFIAPFLRWLIPGISDAAIGTVRLVVRKCAHLGEYAVLAWLVGAALHQSFNPRRWQWSGRMAALALLVCLAYALSDEWHQSFVPSRQATLRDVGIDALGALVMLTVLWAWNRRSPPAVGERKQVAADSAAG